MNEKNSVAIISILWAIVLLSLAFGINKRINSKNPNSLASQLQKLEETIDNENP